MATRLVCLPILLALAMPSPASGTLVEATTYRFPHDVMVFDLPTATNGVDYRLYVRPPLREPDTGGKPTGIYLLDPASLFPAASTMAANYEVFNYMPAAYFIGIGYQDDADRVYSTQ